MNAEQLLQHFERISEAPDAIPRLRRFILDLAVRGKLVEQDPSDEPASELLKRIATEKARLVKAGEIKKQKPLPPLTSDELFNAIPSGWAVARLEGISVCLDYKREPINGSERQKRIEGKPPDCLFPYFGATQQQGWIDDYLFDEDLVLLGEDGVPFFDPLRSKAYLISGKTWVNNHAHVFKCILASHSYLVHYLNAFDYSGRVVGATRSKLNQARAVDIPIPLPPLPEQHRIVAKVDELMFLCDQLEAAKAEQEQCRDSLVAASLQGLNQPAEEEETFREHARFTFNNLPRITTRTVHIKQLRQTILNLAVRGALGTSQSDDPSALEDIKLIKDRKMGAALRKPKPIAPIEKNEQWCSLPCGWEWTRWDQITDWITYGFTRPMPHEAVGVPIVTGKNVNHGRIIYETADRTPQAAYNTLSDKDKPQTGDILITKDGSIGRTAVVEGDKIFCINQSVAVLWLRSCHLNRRFLQMVLDCPATQLALLERTAGVAIKHISINDLGKMAFPLPPLPEQHRIVAKVTELTAICDQLEAQITEKEQDSRRFLESVLADALAPGIDLSAEAQVA
jgi:type I restriction enzyme, S subunit